MILEYNYGVVQALNDLGIVKTANPEVAAQIASGADPGELQAVAENKVTEKDLESAAKVVQVMAQMKQMADEAGMMPMQGGAPGGAAPGGMGQAAPPQAPAMPTPGMGAPQTPGMPY